MSAVAVVPFLFCFGGNSDVPGRGRFFLYYASFFQHLHVPKTSLPTSIRLLISPRNALYVQQRQDNLMDSAG